MYKIRQLNKYLSILVHNIRNYILQNILEIHYVFVHIYILDLSTRKKEQFLWCKFSFQFFLLPFKFVVTYVESLELILYNRQ